MEIKVSLILPVYNVEKYLPRCLDSILAQTMPADDLEVILVDDGSKDGSGKIIDDYASKYEHIKALHRENGGAAAARNTGLSKAHGRYVAFVDPDDYIEPDYCLLPYQEAVRSGADIVLFDAYKETEGETKDKARLLGHADTAFFTDSGKDIESMRCQILYPYMASQVGNIRFKADIPLAAPWDKFYKRQFLVDNGLYFHEDMKVLDDMCFNFTAFNAAASVSYIPKALYHYQVWNTSITNSYKADRPEQDMKVFDLIHKLIKEDKTCQDELMQAYYARIIKSFAICCRLCFFNEKNPEDNKGRLKKVKSYMESDPYKTAFRKIRLGGLEWKLVIVALAGRMKSPGIMHILHMLQNQ